MHEASLVEGLLNIINSSLEDYNKSHPDKPAAKVREIICSYGLLACFEEHTLRACFELFVEGTAAENAVLTLKAEPLNCQCGQCGKNFQLAKRHFVCPFCASDNINFKGGNGLVLQAINVDSEEEDNG